jgi:hypothetical protein
VSSKDLERVVRSLGSPNGSCIRKSTNLINKGKVERARVCTRTVQRALRAHPESGLVYGKPVVQEVSARNAEKRRLATGAAQIKGVRKKLKRLVFLDATTVRWCRARGFQPHRNPLCWSQTKSPKPRTGGPSIVIQFYAAITLGLGAKMHRTPLLFVPMAHSVDADTFQGVAKSVKKWADEDVFGDEHYEVVQDNATCHTARRTKEWLASNQGYKLHPHPPQSPDLNSIERAWAIFKHDLSVCKKRPQSLEAARKVLQDVWGKVKGESLQGVIRELPSTMARVHGNPTRHVA